MHQDPSPPPGSVPDAADGQAAVSPATIPPPPGPGGHRARRLLAGTAVFVLVAGATAGAITAFVLTRSAAPSVSLMVPADAAFYASVEIHPSGAQELALSHLLSAFPALATQSMQAKLVDGLLDGSLKDTGLTHADILPWLGQEIGVSVGAGASGLSSVEPSIAAYVDTTDDSQTLAALTTARSSGAGSRFTDTGLEYRGVAITQVTPAAAGDPGGAYALVDHVLVLAGSESYLEEIIDTAQGSHPSLANAADYTAAVAQLSADRLATLYADVPTVLSAALSAMGGRGSELKPLLDQLTAFRGAAAGVEAVTGGLAVDWVVDDDSGQLTTAEKQALAAAPDHNSTALDTPANAALFVGVTGFPSIVSVVIGGLSKSLPAGASFLVQGVLSDLSGDAGIEIDPSASGGLGGAAIIATSAPAAAGQLLDLAIPMLVAGASKTPPSVGHTTYLGTEFSELQGADGVVAWTVTHGAAIIATSPGQMEAVLSAIDGGNSLGASTDYARTAGAQTADGAVYVNAGQVIAALGGSLSQIPGASQVLANLEKIESISMTETSTSGHIAGHFLIEVP